MPMSSIMGWLADQDPDRPAILCGDAAVTRRQLDRRSNQLARAYANLGVGHGDVVTIGLPNGIEFYESLLATWKLGAVPQPVSHRLPASERAAIIDLANPSLLVGGDPVDGGGRAWLPAGFRPARPFSGERLGPQVSPHWKIMTSGGSTGRPKLIVDAEPALFDPVAPRLGMRLGGSQLVPGPLYHQGPFIFSTAALFHGNVVTVMPRFDPAEALELIERHRVDWVYFVPTMMQRIWRLGPTARQARDLSSLRVVLSTGAPWPVWLKEAWIGWLGPERIFEAYGGTERQGGTLIDGFDALARPGSVGRPAGGNRLRVLDEHGAEVAPGVVGEIYFMPAGGTGSTYRYIGAEPRSHDGWETLGDLGYLDDEGYLYLVDRRVDLIVTGGANVYPAEVEAALDAHPSVRSSAVIGLPDDDLGHRVHAIVDIGTATGDRHEVGEGELIDHLRSLLVPYKLPRSIELVDRPLRDDAGKVRRSALRDERLRRPTP
jgi:bile acid-coenzyme A ligase